MKCEGKNGRDDENGEFLDGTGLERHQNNANVPTPGSDWNAATAS
jgi:hypothetical protein